MPRFSERYGHVKARTTFQIGSADESLRSTLWNVIVFNYFPEDVTYVEEDPDLNAFLRLLYHDFHRATVDNIDYSINEERKKLKSFVVSSPWYRLYDLIEFVVQSAPADYSKFGRDSVAVQLNEALEKGRAGYRVLEGLVTPITDEIELNAVDGAMAVPNKYALAREHIKTAPIFRQGQP